MKPTVVASSVLIRADGAVLLGRRADCGLWNTPGGKCEDESLADAGRREMAEECGLRLLGEPSLLTVTEDYGQVPPYDQQRFVVIHLRWFLWKGKVGEGDNSHTAYEWFRPNRALRERLMPGCRKLMSFLDGRC